MAGFLQNSDGSGSSKRLAAFLFGGVLIVGGLIVLIVSAITSNQSQWPYIGGMVSSGLGVLVLLVLLGFVTITDVKEIVSKGVDALPKR